MEVRNVNSLINLLIKGLIGLRIESPSMMVLVHLSLNLLN
jgi:hypothetical protein